VDAHVVALLEAVHAEARRHGQFANELCQTLFAQLLLSLLSNEPFAAPPRLPLPLPDTAAEDAVLAKRLEQFLRENCAQPIDQKSLSASLRFSYRHLHNVWRRHHRESPLQALWHYRVERATQLIRYSNYELKRIAELTGFATVHHFTRVFTRINGVSPARWREREREGIRQDIAIRPGDGVFVLKSDEQKQPTGSRRPQTLPFTFGVRKQGPGRKAARRGQRGQGEVNGVRPFDVREAWRQSGPARVCHSEHRTA